MGQAVRYDGKDKYSSVIIKALSEQVEFIPICPEVGIGLSVPREKIQLSFDNNQYSIRQISDTKINHTLALTDYANKVFTDYPDLLAFIFKSKSPSCGLGSTPIIMDNKIKGFGFGQFAYRFSQLVDSSLAKTATVLKNKRKVILIEESQLHNQQQCVNFLNTIKLSW